MLDVPQWRQTILTHYTKNGEVYNNAAAAGITIKQVTTDSQGQPLSEVWRLIGVRLLTAAESGPNQYLYIDLVDQNGQPVRGTTPLIAWTWEGRRTTEAAPPVRPDKPAQEAAGNIGLGTGQKIAVWVQDSLYSDQAINLQAAAAGSNARSFYVLFQRQKITVSPPPGTGVEIFNKYRISFVFNEEKMTIEDVNVTKL